MDKKEFYENVDAIVRTTIAARIEAQTALDGVEEKIKDHRRNHKKIYRLL